MKIYTEDEILKPEVRKQIIDEICQPENKNRKQAAFKKYQVYKDKTALYVIENLLKWLDQDTVEEMAYSVSNVSVCRKIIDKLARVYAMGADRKAMNKDGKVDEELTKKVELLAKYLSLNSNMKKLNRLLKLEKNMSMYIKPTKVIVKGVEKYTIKDQPTAPFLYDVVENANDNEKPLCYIFSHFKPELSLGLNAPLTNEMLKAHTLTASNPLGDNKDQMIADSPSDKDADNKQFIWWSENYHFTTDDLGAVISTNTNMENPIHELTILNFALDQDGQFWAQGGDDLVDGSVLVNSMITHTMHVGVTQGYGQFYMTGANLPAGQKIGPNKGIKIEHKDKDEPTPTLGFLSANPPLSELRQLIEMYVALMLTTNNLSTSGVASNLGTGNNPVNGIAMILDKAESMEDVQDQEQIFKDREPEMWRVIAKWLNLYSKTGELVDELKDLVIPEDIKVEVSFPDARPIMTEKEKLDNLKIRKDLGINTEIELIKMDNPDLTDEQAEEKLAKILEARMKKVANAAKDAVNKNLNQVEDGQDEPV